MNWFQRLWSTPKAHAAATVVATVATAIVPPQYQLVAGALAALFGLNAAILPHPDIMPLPATGSLHGKDYVNVVLPALGLPPVPLPATGSLHAADYAALILALTAAMQALPPAPADPAKPAA
jgi:hypothetical protein